MSCPYSTLGLQRGASADEIKKAYRALVVEHHPDKHATAPQTQQAAAAARFKVIQEAYQMLSDDRQRAAYEASRSTGRPNGYPYGYSHNVNTDWTTSSHQSGFRQSAYSSRMGQWEYLRRAAKQGMHSFDKPLHFGLVFLLVGGVFLFDTAHNLVWESRNKGKRFEDIQAAKHPKAAESPEAAAAAENGGGGTSSGVDATADASNTGDASGTPVMKSAWLDSMRGRVVKDGQQQQQQQQQEQQQQQQPEGVDKAVEIRSSPPGQMSSHRMW